MGILCKEIRHMARGETNKGCIVDWGDNTAGQETGILSSGDTVASCTVSIVSRPPGSLAADDPTLSAVTVPTNTADADGNYQEINGRVWATGEATLCTVTTSASQAYGEYVLLFTATTTNGNVLPRTVRVIVR